MFKSLGTAKKISTLFLIGIIVFFAVYNFKVEKTPNAVEAYTTVIDKLYKEDSGLNGDIKYLAIDTSLMVNLNDKTKVKLLKHLEKYGFTVLDMSFEDLQKTGYIKNLQFEEGILFQIEDEPMENNRIKMKASKWRSGKGAIGYNHLILNYKDGKWEISGLNEMWIS